MTQEEKQLLLKDLCARLSYGVIISWCNEKVEHKRFILESITSKKYKSYIRDGKQLAINGEYIEWKLNNIYILGEFIKPYLRPMSSMTEEEIKYKLSKFFKIINTDVYLSHIEGIGYIPTLNSDSAIEYVNWLMENHFDYHGLIPMGLALEAKEGMYK